MSTTTSSGESTEALNGKLTFEQSKNRIVGRDATNLIRLLILADGNDFVMKVAKEGFDATNASDDELIFNSNQNTFKIATTINGTATTPALTTGANTWGVVNNTNTIAHGLGFVPIPQAFINDSGLYTPLQYSFFNVAGGNPWWYTLRVRVDATNIYLVTTVVGYNISLSSGSFPVKIYLLQETAN